MPHLSDAAVPALTPRQQAILDYVVSHARERGYAPTVREIGDRFGIRSPNAVACHLDALRRKGRVTSEPGRARTLRAVTPRTTLPLAGTVG